LKSRIDAVLASALGRWVDAVQRRATLVAIGVLAVTVPIGAYAVLELGINSDNVQLVGRDLPARRNHDEFAKLFPNLENALLVVVDGETPELTRQAADALTKALRQRSDAFTDVYLPGGGAFFERNGLLYRSVDDLYAFADEMARVQPIIAELERDPSIANMARLVRQGLKHAREDDAAGVAWPSVLDRVGEATVEVYAEYPLAVSWEEVLLRGSSIEVVKRRVIVAHPILDFDSLLPAGRPLQVIKETARQLGYVPEKGVTVRVTGNPALNYEEMLGLAWDIGGSGILCFLVVALILHRALRSLRLVLASVATLLVGLVWTAGFAAAAVGRLNVVSISFGILFIGLGVDFCIHLGMRYADLLREHREHAGALRAAVEEVGSSLVICAATTSIGFFVFIPTDYKGVAELGLIAGAGMPIILALTLTFFPALLGTWLRVDPERLPTRPLVFHTTWWRRLERHPAAVRWAALAAGLASAALLTQARFDPNVVRMRDPSTTSVQAFEDLLADSGTSSPWYVDVVAGDLAEAQALGKRLDALPVVDHTVTAADYVPADQDEKLGILQDIAFLMDAPPAGPAPQRDEPSVEEQVAALRELHDFLQAPWIAREHSPLAESMLRLRDQLGVFLERLDREGNAPQALAALEKVLLSTFPEQVERLRRALEAEPIRLDDLPPELRRRMLAPDGRARIQVFPAENLQDEDSLARFVDGVRTVAPKATGVAVNLLEFGRAAIGAFQQAVISALLVIAALLWFMWRTLRETLLALAPLVLAALLTGAALVVLDMPFNYVNVVVIPLLLGIGVDSGIHLVHRAQMAEISEAELMETTTARAVFYSALTTAVSFGSLTLSSHRGMQSLGLLLVIGLACNVLANLVVLPALLDWRSRKAG
jgi:hopanoid biosynthesis associated RND transporter like protein HpnN